MPATTDTTAPLVTGTAPTVVDVVIVGGGPRAVSTVERLTAREAGRPLRVVVVDAVEVGAGATWRTDQSPHLLNNTYSAHTTIYPDSSTPMAGPIRRGPDLVEWARDVVARVPRPTADPSARWHAGPRPAWVAAEAAAVEPWSFPTRRLQGVYFREQLEAVLARGGVELTAVEGTVVGIDPAESGLSAGVGRLSGGGGGVRVVRLADGRAFQASAVVLAQGMVQAARSRQTRELVAAAKRYGLTYVEPGMPAERDWDVVPAGEDVLVAGLGANFFDVLALLTEGRGGRFLPGARPFELGYEPSGREPRLLVGSRRGLPYRSKSWYGGFPPVYRPQLATAEWFASVAEVPDQDFRRDVWPQLAREFVVAHLATLAAHHPAAVPRIVDGAAERPAVDGRHPSAAATVPLPTGVLQRIAATDAGDLPALVRELVAEPQWWLDPQRLDRPEVRTPSPEQWQHWTRRWREAELASLGSPLTSPRATVNRAMALLRGQVARLVTGGAIAAGSVQRDVNGWFGALGLALASGPPPQRTALLLALIDAGVVELLGEGTTVRLEGGRFVARSQVVGREHRTRAFIETRMSKGQVDVTDDPLLRTLLDTGRARLLTRRDADGTVITARTLEVSPEDYTLIDAQGRPDPRVIVLGIPAGDAQPGSAIGATPGVPSPLIAGADRAARQVLELVRQSVPVG